MLEFHGHFGSWTLTSSAIVNRPRAIISCLVTENTLAGAIPTQIGHLAQLTDLHLTGNLLTGKHFFAQIDRMVHTTQGKMSVYQTINKTFLLHRQHSDGAWAVYGYVAPPAVRQPIDR